MNPDRGLQRSPLALLVALSTLGAQPTGAAVQDRARSLAVSGDTLVIGAWGEGQGGQNAGSATAYSRIGGPWKETARLLAPDPGPLEDFGVDVAIGPCTLIVGSPEHDAGGMPDTGAACVFSCQGQLVSFP